MRRIFLLTIISVIFAGGVLALISNQPSLSSRTTAMKAGDNLKLSANPSPKHRFDSLKNLVERSPEIVVGIPIGKSTYRRSEADQMVFTDYEVQVLENLKGDRHKGRKLTLRVPGGFMSLADGKTVEVTMPDFWKNPEIGKGYIFFLTRRRDSPSVLVGGPQGAFEISPWPESVSLTTVPDISQGRVVVPQVRDTDELMKNYRGKEAGNIIEQIKQMVGTFRPVSKRTTTSPKTESGSRS